MEKSHRATQQTGTHNGTVQSLARALSILNALAASDRGLSLSETAARTGLAVSTTHRLLNTLQQKNFVQFNQDQGIWTIGVQSFIVGNAFLRVRELSQIARPNMRELMESTGETVNLAVENQGEAIYIAQIESHMTMRAIAKPGGRAAMHASGVGKALLATMDDEAVNQILMRHGMPKLTGNTLVVPEELKNQLLEARQKGYAVDDEENAIGLRCIAAAIVDETGQAVGAISLSGPTVRVRSDLISSLGEAVKTTADHITIGLGGSPIQKY
ncbi:MAG: helix-turn-helix domain-containing protein [Hyphomicrobiales bacterium]|nr:helix-turn-helix domain-containing protein [Hyphomicrobiales bacterium]